MMEGSLIYGSSSHHSATELVQLRIGAIGGRVWASVEGLSSAVAVVPTFSPCVLADELPHHTYAQIKNCITPTRCIRRFYYHASVPLDRALKNLTPISFPAFLNSLPRYGFALHQYPPILQRSWPIRWGTSGRAHTKKVRFPSWHLPAPTPTHQLVHGLPDDGGFLGAGLPALPGAPRGAVAAGRGTPDAATGSHRLRSAGAGRPL